MFASTITGKLKIISGSFIFGILSIFRFNKHVLLYPLPQDSVFKQRPVESIINHKVERKTNYNK